LARACGWSGIVTGERNFRWISRFAPTGPQSWRSSLEGERLISSFTRSGTLLSAASRPRNLSRSCTLSRSGGSAEGGAPCSRRGGGSGSGGAKKVFDSQTAGGYSPPRLPSLRRFGLGFLETERDGEEQCMQSIVRSGAPGPATDQIRRVKLPEMGGATRAGRMSIRK
jgi:hypothetical protein